MAEHNILVIHKDVAEAKAVLKRINWSELNTKNVAFVSNGDAAFALLLNQQYDSILMDAGANCAGDVLFLPRVLERYPDVMVMLIACPMDTELLLGAMRNEAVYDYVNYPLQPDEVAEKLKKGYKFWEGMRLASTIVQLSDINQFDVPTALKKNIRSNIRAILKDVADANLNAVVQGVSVLFHETLALHCKQDLAFSKAVTLELVSQIKYLLLGLNLEYDREFVAASFAHKVNIALTNEDLEDLCLYFLRRCIHLIDPSGSNNQMSSLVRTAIKITRQRYSDSSFTLVSLSDEIGISPNYLSSVFKMEAGIRFKKYLNTFRIERAKELLADGHYKIYEVANLVGIEDSRYFSQIFRTYTGLKPSEYRNVCVYGEGEPHTDPT